MPRRSSGPPECRKRGAGKLAALKTRYHTGCGASTTEARRYIAGANPLRRCRVPRPTVPALLALAAALLGVPTAAETPPKATYRIRLTFSGATGPYAVDNGS